MASSSRRGCKNKADSFCNTCGSYTLLRQRRNITLFKQLAYKVQDHITDCYFCLVGTKDIGKKNWPKISYPSIPLAN